jgi:hypothetical protein
MLTSAEGESVDVPEKHKQYEAAAAQLRRVLGEMPVEFASAGELVALLSQIPADTPVNVAWEMRESPRPDEDAPDNDRLTATAYPTSVSNLATVRHPDGGSTMVTWPVAAVQLGGFWAAKHDPVPAVTVAVSPWDRAMEAMRSGDDATLFAAYREMLADIAGGLDGVLTSPRGTSRSSTTPGCSPARSWRRSYCVRPPTGSPPCTPASASAWPVDRGHGVR